MGGKTYAWSGNLSGRSLWVTTQLAVLPVLYLISRRKKASSSYSVVLFQWGDVRGFWYYDLIFFCNILFLRIGDTGVIFLRFGNIDVSGWSSFLRFVYSKLKGYISYHNIKEKQHLDTVHFNCVLRTKSNNKNVTRQIIFQQHVRRAIEDCLLK